MVHVLTVFTPFGVFIFVEEPEVIDVEVTVLTDDELHEIALLNPQPLTPGGAV